MNESVPLILRLIAASLPVADHAGKIIRDVMKTGELNIVDKGIADYQTQADRSAHQYIVSTLARRFPKINIIGEEDDSLSNEPVSDSVDDDKTNEEILKLSCPEYLKNVKDSQITVWVDPLDGTSEYTQGLLEHVTVLIGIAVDDKAVAGIINQPYYGHKEKADCGRSIWGIIGLGAFGFQPKEPPKDRKIVTTTRSHSNKVVLSTIDSIKPDEVIKVGGSGHKVLLLIEGIAHAYVFASAGTKRWDTCAPEAILHAVGGKMTDMNGNFYKYNKDTEHNNKGGILATYKEAEHASYLNLIPDEVKNAFK
ncbi:3'(2'),5'-bisphosphate nucleotidase 1 isoform X2 [Planococcus citri]